MNISYLTFKNEIKVLFISASDLMNFLSQNPQEEKKDHC